MNHPWGWSHQSIAAPQESNPNQLIHAYDGHPDLRGIPSHTSTYDPFAWSDSLVSFEPSPLPEYGGQYYSQDPHYESIFSGGQTSVLAVNNHDSDSMTTYNAQEPLESDSLGASSEGKTAFSSQPDWYDECISEEDKFKVLSIMTRFLYGKDNKHHRKSAQRFILSKFNPKMFYQVLHSEDDRFLKETFTGNITRRRTDKAQARSESKSHSNNPVAPDWFLAQDKKDKSTVISKMTQAWFGSKVKKYRTLARYRMLMYFTQQDFEDVLHSSESEEGEMIVKDVAMRTRNAPGYEPRNEDRITSIQTDEHGNEEWGDALDGPNDDEYMPPWYRTIGTPQDKKYVISRMTFMWFKKLDEVEYREKARLHILRTFTPQDFLLVANPDTDSRVLMEIAKKHSPDTFMSRIKQVAEMKRGIVERGLMNKYTLNKYVRDAVKNHGYGRRSIDELRDFVLYRWKNRSNAAG